METIPELPYDDLETIEPESSWPETVEAVDPSQLEELQGGSGLMYGVISPRDAASGLPTGKRQHKPL